MKKKILFLSLINFFLLPASSEVEDIDNYFEYTISKGDSLWSISRKFDVKINELIKANKSSRYEVNIPKIYAGDTLYVPTNLSYEDPINFCFSTSDSLFGLNLSNLSTINLLNNCLDKLSFRVVDVKFDSDKLDDNFWNNYLNDEAYPFYYLNLMLLYQEKRYGYFKESFNESELYDVEEFIKAKELEMKKKASFLREVIFEGTRRGDTTFIWNYYLFNSPESKEIKKNAIEIHLSKIEKEILTFINYGSFDDLTKLNAYNQLLKYDTSFLNENELALFLSGMLDITYSSNDIRHFEIKKRATDLLTLSKTRIISLDQIDLLSELMDYEIKTGNFQKAYLIAISFLKRHGHDSLDQFLGTYIKNMNGNKYGSSIYHERSLFNFFDKFMVSQRNYLGLGFEEYLKKRLDLINQYHLELIEADTPTAFLPDTFRIEPSYRNGMVKDLVGYRKCDEAQKYVPLFEYNNQTAEELNGEEFFHTLLLSLCYADNENILLANDYLYRSINFYERYQGVRDYLAESFFPLMEFYIRKIQGYDLDISKLEKLIEDLFSNEYFLSFSDNGLFNEFLNIYAFIYKDLSSDEKQTLKHPIETNYLFNRVYKSRNVNHIKIEKNKRYANRISSQIKKNGLAIAEEESELINNEGNLTKIQNLYKDRTRLIEKLFNNQKNLKELNSPDFYALEKIQENLESNEYILNYQVFSNRTLAILISKTDEEVIEIDVPKTEIIANSYKLKNSLADSQSIFDFQASNNLYKSIFKPLEEAIQDYSTVYLLGSNLEEIPFNALVSKVPDKSNYTRNLVEAPFLIDRFTFVRIFPLTKKRNTSFKEKYISFANPDSSLEMGLPSLPSAEEEAILISMASGSRKNNFFGKDATKENVLKLIENNYERVHFGTHSVPPYWKDLVSESSLVLSSNKGDYLLSASEISALEIESDVVLLSSCDASSDGFDSLYKAFLVAGSNSVIYSNWELETNSATLITTELFKSIWQQEDAELHEALRSSLLKLKRSYRDKDHLSPYFWANFSIAYGNI